MKEVWVSFGYYSYDTPGKFSFKTQAELDAFLLGVEECCGSLIHQVFHSQDEADEFEEKECGE